MTVVSVLNQAPFVDFLGMEITEAADGHAEGVLELRQEHSSNPSKLIAHGGVTYALADNVGGAAVISKSGAVSPTVDMRIDYLAPATEDLRAEADVLRFGGNVAVVDVEVYDEHDRHVATARGNYKVTGQGEVTPWTDGTAEGIDPTALDALDGSIDGTEESTEGVEESTDTDDQP